MIKKLSFLLALLCLLPILLACGEVDDGRLSVVATNFAAYDFAREIVGDKTDTVKVEFLAAGDAHSFNPTFGDMTKIQGADLFLYVGGISDAPIDTLLAGVEGVNTLKLLDCVTPLYEKDEHEDGDEHEHGKTALDEHVWTSPKNAGLIVGAILEKIVALDPINEADYRKNAATYAAKLTKLDEAFEMLFKEQTKAVVFGDRFPLLYFAEAYKMRYEAAFPSCHATSEPSPTRVAELIALVKAENIPTVFYIEGGTHTVADRIAAESEATTRLFHSCHKVSAEEMANGVSYLSLMEQNYEALKDALGS